MLNRDDQWHPWSVAVLTVLSEQIATTETVLAEACYHLRRQREALSALVELVETEQVRLVPVLSSDPSRVRNLLASYPRMDCGDASLVVLSEMFPHAKLITTDREDFTIYRRFDKSSVPCIMPPVES